MDISFSVFWFYLKVFNGSCAFISSVLSDICFLLSPPPLLSEHFLPFMPRCPALVNLLYSCCFSSMWGSTFLEGSPTGCSWVLMVSCLSTFQSSCSDLAFIVKPLPVLPVVPTFTSEWEPLLLELTTCYNLSVPQHLGPWFPPCFCLAVILLWVLLWSVVWPHPLVL